MHNTDDDFAGLLLIPGVGRAKARALFSAGFKTIDDIAKADPASLAKLPGISLEKAREIIDYCLVMASVETDSDKLEAKNELLICPLCGSMVGAGSSICPGCGITFSDDVEDIEPDISEISGSDKNAEKDGFWYKDQGGLFICPECGSLVSDGASKCPKCGVQFAEETEEPEQTGPAEADSDGYWYKEDSALFMCPGCGAFIRKDAESCSACGIAFETDGEEDDAPAEITCPMCKASLPASSSQCPGCGFDFTKEKEEDGFWYRAQSELLMCPGCGAFISKDAHQCTTCGIALEDEETTEAEPAPPASCPMCKKALGPDAQICDNCGFDFTAAKENDGFWYEDKPAALFICPNCGAFISESANNCINCGMVFDEDGESVGVTPDAEKSIANLADDLDSYLQEQVDALIDTERLVAARRGWKTSSRRRRKNLGMFQQKPRKLPIYCLRNPCTSALSAARSSRRTCRVAHPATRSSMTLRKWPWGLQSSRNSLEKAPRSWLPKWLRTSMKSRRN